MKIKISAALVFGLYCMATAASAMAWCIAESPATNKSFKVKSMREHVSQVEHPFHLGSLLHVCAPLLVGTHPAEQATG